MLFGAASSSLELAEVSWLLFRDDDVCLRLELFFFFFEAGTEGLAAAFTAAVSSSSEEKKESRS